MNKDDIYIKITEKSILKAKKELIKTYEILKDLLTTDKMPYDLEDCYPIKDALTAIEESLIDLGEDI